MVRETVSVNTSFDAFIYSENAIFSSLVTELTLKPEGFEMEIMKSTIIFPY